MLSKLKGVVEEIEGNTITLDVQGVGYEVLCSGSCIERLTLAAPVSLVVYTDVSESAIRLYGFVDIVEKQVFVLLTTVQGVGAKTSMEILSQIDRVELLRAIGAGDLKRLQSLRGVGKKTAERIVVELKDKVAEYAVGRTESRIAVEKIEIDPMRDACDALEALGIPRKDAERAVAAVHGRGLEPAADSAWVVKEALRYI